MEVSYCQVEKEDHFDDVMYASLSAVQPHQGGSLRNLTSFYPSMKGHAVLVQHISQASKHSAIHIQSYMKILFPPFLRSATNIVIAYQLVSPVHPSHILLVGGQGTFVDVPSGFLLFTVLPRDAPTCSVERKYTYRRSYHAAASNGPLLR